jgi:predicted ATPase
MPELPTGTVTFLFTDIEGSTRLLDELGAEAYAEALAGHRRIVRDAIARHGGVEVDTQGDAFFVAFPEASAAVTAAGEAQRGLADHRVRVRMGLHTGTARVSDGGYIGSDVHLGARVAAAGHGGQVLMSSATRGLIAYDVLDLGQHRLKDFDSPLAIYQLGHDRYPPLRTISNTNLPRPASPLVGRTREIAEVTARLQNGARLLTLTGPGGMGKTRLAIESASELVSHNRNGVFWVPLASLTDPALVMSEVGQTLGAKGSVAEHVGASEMLLLLDNFEQVVDAAPELAELLQACANLRLLVTSRERLRVAGEVEYAVPPLAEPEAVELFTARTGIADDGDVAELCRRLDNLPLAVELAAARASVLSPAQMLERLGQRLDLLKGGRDADARQQTLRATIEWSHDLLNAEEQALFARLAVFRGGCALEAAEEVIEADVDTLQSLVDKSLVRHSNGRFWMLETIREFAAERLDESGMAETMRRSHAVHYLALAEEVESALVGPGSDRWHDLIQRDHENIRSALDHFEATSEIESAMRLSGAIAEFWDQRAHHPEALLRYTRLLEADTRPTPARAKALDAASMIATKSGHQQTAVKWQEEALALHRQFGDKRGTAIAMWGLGYLWVEDGNYVAAQDILRESVDLLGEVGDDVAAAWATRTLAFSYFKPGDNARARPLYEETLRRAREIGDADLEAHGLGALAEYAIDDGRPLEAALLARQTLQIVAGAADPLLVTSRLSGVARVLSLLGRPTVAARLISHAEFRHEEIGAREIWVATENQKTISLIHAALDEATFAREWDEGRKLSPEAAMALAIAELDDAVERNRAN